MSSSRSIAAARNRRSGDTSMPIQQQSRPNKSIGGQAAFVPQQQPQQTRRPVQQQIQQQQMQQIPQTQQGPSAITKLSVSDAIGLVTLRLGRLEQFMFDVQAGVIEPSGEARENSQVFDKSVITSIVNRIDTLEKREHGSSSSANNNAFAAQIKKLETELKDIKELLLHHIIKHEKLIIENDKKFSEIDATLDEFESKLLLSDNDFVQEEVEIGEETVELEESVETAEISITIAENNA